MARKTVSRTDQEVARRLRAAMTIAGVGVADLCAPLQMTPSGVRGLLSEERRRAPITGAQFCLVAVALAARGVRPGFLLTGQGPILEVGPE